MVGIIMKNIYLYIIPFILINSIIVETEIFAQNTQSEVRVLDSMSVSIFRAAGLEKLSKEEIAVLDNWLNEFVMKMSQQAGTDQKSGSNNLANLEGATIVADDGQFLGIITKNRVATNSILNSVGSYGSRVSRTSIFNQVGQYGSQVSRLSPFNRVASSPPRIFVGNEFIAYLTVNTTKQPRIDPNALIGWLQSN